MGPRSRVRPSEPELRPGDAAAFALGGGKVKAPVFGLRPTTEGVSGTRVGDPKTQAFLHMCILDPQACCTRRGEGVSAVSPEP